MQKTKLLIIFSSFNSPSL